MKKIIGQTMGDFVITNVYGHNEVEIVCQHCGEQRVIGYNQNIKVCKCQKVIGKYIGQVVNGFEILDGYCRTSKSGKSRAIVYKVKCVNCGKESEKYRNCLFKDAKCRCDCNKTVGPDDGRLYIIWCSMRARCAEGGHKKYYGRGIKVCDEWQESFVAFKTWARANGYTDELTIDRIDNDGNYEPSNCRWATREEQANNRKSNHLLTLGNKTMTIAEWSRETGLPERTIWARLDLYHWPVKDVLTKPIGQGIAKRGRVPRKVIGYKDGQVFMEFESVKKAAEYFGCDIASIRSVLRGKWKTSCGLTWAYAEEVN